MGWDGVGVICNRCGIATLAGAGGLLWGYAYDVNVGKNERMSDL